MRDPNVEYCDVCKTLFCCAACRDKHVAKQHPQFLKLKTPPPLECPLCLHQPLPLQRTMNKSVLQHIENEHLPLHCRKCSKIYESIAELNNFTSCLQPQSKCNLTQDINNNEASVHIVPTSMIAGTQNTIATQTSPLPGNENTTIDKTPLYLLQQNSKTKLKNDFISDSVSSIKNLSSLSNISLRHSIDVIRTTTSRGKLVRTTSTPVQSDLLIAKPKEPTFNASSAQVSSIYSSEVEHVPERTPALSNVNGSCSSPTRQKLDNLQKYRKIGSRSKVAAVTPLRQVMSKSIQKAFAEHGALRNASGAAMRHKLLDSLECEIVHSSPLDLRVSPVVRRSRQLKVIEQRYENKPVANKLENITEMTTNYESPSYKNQEIQMSSQKISTESIIITRTQHLATTRNNFNGSNQSAEYKSMAYNSNLENNNSCSNSESVFQTCQSVEIITATEYSALKVHNECKMNNKNKKNDLQFIENTAHNMTPISREPGTLIQKKMINFETPIKEFTSANKSDGKGNGNKTFSDETMNMENSNADAFFTPESTPLTKNFTPSNTSTKTGTSGSNKISRKKLVVRRQLSGNFSPKRRPPIRMLSKHEHFKNIAQVDSEDSDEVFVPSVSAPKEVDIKVNKYKKEIPTERHDGWSLGSLVNSVIALPTAIQSVRERFSSDSEIKTNKYDSILKRCASIAGNLVRSNSLRVDPRSIKRKRIHTLDEGHSTFLLNLNSTTFSSPEIVNSISKRLRIQSRPPIRYGSP